MGVGKIVLLLLLAFALASCGRKTPLRSYFVRDCRACWEYPSDGTLHCGKLLTKRDAAAHVKDEVARASSLRHRVICGQEVK